MEHLFRQRDFGIRLDWGPAGAQATAADVSVVVDVLSFSTSVTIAVERGMQVHPYRWRDQGAEAFAAEHDAVLAVGRLEARRSGTASAPSLSPAGLLTCPVVPRLVLPSPNGSTIAAALDLPGATVAIGCLRNAESVAKWLTAVLETGRTVAMIAAGEQWENDNSLRPALEDHLGAGAILSALARSGHYDRMSPEACAAVDLFDASRTRLENQVRECVSGRELASKGFSSDVDVAAARDTSKVVPVLVDGAFVAAP